MMKNLMMKKLTKKLMKKKKKMMMTTMMTMTLRSKMKTRKMKNQKPRPSEKWFGNGKESMMSKLFGTDPKKILKMKNTTISINLSVKIMRILLLIFISTLKVKSNSDLSFIFQNTLHMINLKTIMVKVLL